MKRLLKQDRDQPSQVFGRDGFQVVAIDLDRTATNLYEIDFNKAYIPYCYYNPAYACPYPPKENRLQFPVHAGERMKK